MALYMSGKKFKIFINSLQWEIATKSLNSAIIGKAIVGKAIVGKE